MRYISTRGRADELDFEEAMLTGLARDGGLYVPQSFPTFSDDDIAALAGLRYEEVAFRIMQPFVGGTIDDTVLRQAIEKGYSAFRHVARAPMVQLKPGHFLLELFHGPTMAFKDFPMQVIGPLFQSVLARKHKRITIVGATSGDTGSAAIEAFRGLENVDIFILYPAGRVSDVQRRQMTTPTAANVHAVAIEGDFDVCQARLKDLFNDLEFRDEIALTAINSINWARILAQIVYYVSSAVELGAPGRTVSFTVPTGNFGDIFAGFVAKSMGLPIDRLIVATNQNDILHRCLSGHGYYTVETLPSISPSMDIQVSSNFERALFFAYDRDGRSVTHLMSTLENGGFDVPHDVLRTLTDVYGSGRVSEEETRATIARVYEETGRLICPHTAVGVRVAEDFLDPTVPMISLATAHPSKFPTAVESACGVHPPLPSLMDDLYDKPERFTQIADDTQAIQDYIRRARRQ